MVYNYTIPRAPIAAMFGSPGPCYGMPGLVGHPRHDPRSVHDRRPAYSFGVRHGKMTDDCTPGPCYLPSPKIYRDGKDGTPHYSLYSRRNGAMGAMQPGPGAYSPEKSTSKGTLSAHYRPPAYSFGLRHMNRRTDNTPGPNVYTMDPMVGKTIRSDKRQSPQYTLRGRSNVGSFCQDMARTPGPGAYRTTHPEIYKVRGPGYSLTGRNTMPGDHSLKPGPGAHSPEMVRITRRSAPACSFGIRHSQYSAPLIVAADA